MLKNTVIEESFVLASAVKHIQQPPHPLKAQMQRGGCAEEGWGLWDWLPEARSWTGVLQLCCSTQLEPPYAAPLSCWVATPPTHTGGSTVCFSLCVCMFAFIAVVYSKDKNTQVRGKKQSLSCSYLGLDGRIYGAQNSNRLTNRIKFCVMVHCCNAHLFTPDKKSNFDCHCCFDSKHTGI